MPMDNAEGSYFVGKKPNYVSAISNTQLLFSTYRRETTPNPD